MIRTPSQASRRSLSERGMESLVISRAPLLISFGTRVASTGSLEQSRLDSHVVNVAIDYHVYTIIAPSRANGLRMICGGQDVLSACLAGDDPVLDDAMALPHAIAKHFDVREGLSVFLAPPIAPGAGLGLLGSLAVTMIKGLSYFVGVDLEPQDVVELACHIGAKDLGLPPHSHYQYASAYGGISRSTVSADRVSYEPLHVPDEAHASLERNLMLFCTGGTRSPLESYPHHGPCGLQSRADGRELEIFCSLTSKLPGALEDGDLVRFGDVLHRLWPICSAIEGRSPGSPMDQAYETARANGASAGQGRIDGDTAFLVLYCPEADQDGIVAALRPLGWQRWPLMITTSGVQVFEMMSWQPTTRSSGPTWRRFSVPESLTLNPSRGDWSAGS